MPDCSAAETWETVVLGASPTHTLLPGPQCCVSGVFWVLRLCVWWRRCGEGEVGADQQLPFCKSSFPWSHFSSGEQNSLLPREGKHVERVVWFLEHQVLVAATN